YINIKKARHPLLDPEKVVPTNIYLGDEFTTLLITGPNTGGKTVSIKTIGLFTLMGQSGLHISAFDNSELAVFEDVFADIGDEQSIEQSLSTFSSHMSNIIKILKNVTDNSLVLIDELGAGTDPTEGAALAVAIIEYLHKRKIRMAVTTHYSELKVYALSTEGVENASCEFDVHSLRPTYRLLIGIPGKSNAFAISQRLGLPEFIIKNAKEVLSHEDARFEDVITDLEISKKTLVSEQERAEEYRREAEKLKKDFENQKRKTREQRDKIIKKANEDARRIFADAKEEADKIIKDMQKMLRQKNNGDMEAKRRELKDKLLKADESLSKFSNKRDFHKVPKKLFKGDKVFIHTLNQSGIVINPPDTKGDVTIRAGIMTVKVNISNLSLDKTEDTPKNTAKKYSVGVKARKSQYISPEVDLRGLTVEEAVEKTDKYLDDAYLAGISPVTVIHGKGTGVLRSAIQEFLRKNPHVKDFRIGQYGEGESGVTIVELK
ncbi:MAG: endonuclease MutS2, partial [Clostridiales bacterium]|nr:endonuclease MutS2 [Clostridiales bacterium]